MSESNITMQSPVPGALVPSPAPGRTGTPAQGSRAASAHPDPGFSLPSEAVPHGDTTRRYLNTKVSGVLLEGMKQVAKDKSVVPARYLQTVHHSHASGHMILSGFSGSSYFRNPRSLKGHRERCLEILLAHSFTHNGKALRSR
jgi:hypothetical protein